MKALLEPVLDERKVGSRYDPVLAGVAHGLAEMFPPVESVRAESMRAAPARTVDRARREGGRAAHGHRAPATAYLARRS